MAAVYICTSSRAARDPGRSSIRTLGSATNRLRAAAYRQPRGSAPEGARMPQAAPRRARPACAVERTEMNNQTIADEKGGLLRAIENRPPALRSNRMRQLKVSTIGIGEPG